MTAKKLLTRAELHHLCALAKYAPADDPLAVREDRLAKLLDTAFAYYDARDNALEEAAAACDEAVTRRMDLMAEKIRSLKGSSNG